MDYAKVIKPAVPKIATPSANIGTGLAETKPEVATTSLTALQESLTTASPPPPEIKPDTPASSPAAPEEVSLQPHHLNKRQLTRKLPAVHSRAGKPYRTSKSFDTIFCCDALTKVFLSSKSPLANAQFQVFIDSATNPGGSTIPVASSEPLHVIKVRSIAPGDAADENGCHEGTIQWYGVQRIEPSESPLLASSIDKDELRQYAEIYMSKERLNGLKEVADSGLKCDGGCGMWYEVSIFQK
jgi:hypothetical protein